MTEPDLKKCATCNGSGWNRSIGKQGVEIVAPITDIRSLAALKAYINSRLLCPDCKGTGRVE